MCTLSYQHQIGIMNYWPLFRVRSWKMICAVCLSIFYRHTKRHTNMCQSDGEDMVMSTTKTLITTMIITTTMFAMYSTISLLHQHESSFVIHVGYILNPATPPHNNLKTLTYLRQTLQNVVSKTGFVCISFDASYFSCLTIYLLIVPANCAKNDNHISKYLPSNIDRYLYIHTLDIFYQCISKYLYSFICILLVIWCYVSSYSRSLSQYELYCRCLPMMIYFIYLFYDIYPFDNAPVYIYIWYICDIHNAPIYIHGDIDKVPMRHFYLKMAPIYIIVGTTVKQTCSVGTSSLHICYVFIQSFINVSYGPQNTKNIFNTMLVFRSISWNFISRFVANNTKCLYIYHIYLQSISLITFYWWSATS